MSMHPKTKKIHYSVNTLPLLSSSHPFISIHQKKEMILMRVNTFFDCVEVSHNPIPKCFLYTTLTMNNTDYIIEICNSLYYTDNEILSSIFLMNYLHTHHSIVKFDFLYTLECMDNDTITFCSDG